MPRKYTEARKENNRKWDSANLDRISVALPKGSREKIKAYADKWGVSMNSFISKAIDQAMMQDWDMWLIYKRLAEYRDIQTFESLHNEVIDACHLLTSTTWCNVFYNPQLYKSNEEREKIAAELVDGADRIHALFYSLAETVRTGANEKKED